MASRRPYKTRQYTSQHHEEESSSDEGKQEESEGNEESDLSSGETNVPHKDWSLDHSRTSTNFSPRSPLNRSGGSSSPPSTIGSSFALTPSPNMNRRNIHSSSPTPSPKQENFQSPVEPRTYKPDSPKQHPKKPSNSALIPTSIILIMVLGIYFMFKPQSHPPARTEQFDSFVKGMKVLESSFSAQDSRSWKTIRASVKHVLNSTNSEYPAVILFAIPKQSSEVAKCLTASVDRQFREVVNDKESSLTGYIDCRKFSHLDAAAAKLDLDEKIHAHFQSGKVVVIDHLEALHPAATLLLHGLCDGDNAPFKDVLILLGLHLDVSDNLATKNVEKELEKHLSKELDVDKIAALLSRVANNVVVVRHEPHENFQSTCT